MRNMSSTKTQRSALHIPTNSVVTALDVNEEQHLGPWLCPSPNCRVGLTFKPGYQRSNPHGIIPVQVGPHWTRSSHSELHARGCHAQTPQRGAGHYSTRLGRTVHTEDSVLLQFGRRTITQQSGVALPTTTGGASQYAGRAGTLARLLRVLEQVGGHDGMRKYFFVHDGTDYVWDDIAYDATVDEFERLRARRQSLTNHPGTWPWIVWGTVCSHGPATFREGRNQIDLYADSYHDGVRISAFYDNTSPEMLAATQEVQQGSRIVMLLSNLHVAQRFNGLIAGLVDPDEILPWEGLLAE